MIFRSARSLATIFSVFPRCLEHFEHTCLFFFCIFFTLAYYGVYGSFCFVGWLFFFREKKKMFQNVRYLLGAINCFTQFFSQSKSLIGVAQLVVQTLPRNNKVAISIARRSGEFVALSRVRLWLSSLLTWTILEMTTVRRHDQYLDFNLFGRINNNKRAAFSSRSSGLLWCGGKRG